MRIIFALIAAIALLLGVLFVLESQSAIHQILAAITFLIFTVSAATVAILGAISKARSPSPGDRAPAIDTTESTGTKPGGNWVNVGK